MNEARGMRSAQGVQNLQTDLADGLEGQLLTAHELVERLAVQQLHREVRIAFRGDASVENRDDPRVADGGRRARFDQESRGQVGAHAQVRVQHLQRDHGTREAVVSAHHDAHAALADQALDLVPSVDDAADAEHRASLREPRQMRTCVQVRGFLRLWASEGAHFWFASFAAER